jgi:hypothetical protein
VRKWEAVHKATDLSALHKAAQALRTADCCGASAALPSLLYRTEAPMPDLL